MTLVDEITAEPIAKLAYAAVGEAFGRAKYACLVAVGDRCRRG